MILPWHKKCLPLALAFSLSTGCSQAVTEHSAEIFAMNTLISMTLWGNESNEAILASENYIYAIEDAFSTTREESVLYSLNNTQGEWVTLSPEMISVLDYAMEMSAKTGETFTPMVYPLVTAWGFTSSTQRVPSPSEIQSILPFVDDDFIEIDTKNNRVRLSPGAQLDLGGITKGYVGDSLAEYLRSENVQSALISLGGNIYTLGKKTDGSLWNIGIQNPYGAGSVGSVAVYNRAVITSGGYQRYFNYGGETYWHIIDPRSGYPAKSGLASVTIISESGMYGDCLSTALFVMGLEDAIDFWRQHQDFDAVLITDNGDIYITPDLVGQFTLAKGYTSGTLQEIEP